MAHGRKTGGRTVGTVNKFTNEMRDRLQLIFDQYAEGQLHLDMKATDPETRLRFMLEVAKLITPKPPTILGFDNTEQPIFTGIDLSTNDEPQHVHITRTVINGQQPEKPPFPAPIIEISGN